jgi:hypothetical protein
MHYPQHPINADERKPSNVSEASAAAPLPTSPCASHDARQTATATATALALALTNANANAIAITTAADLTTATTTTTDTTTAKATATATASTTATALATTTATATKVEGNVWVTWQLLAAAGEGGWWRRISLSLSADYFNG